jgi:hypothetical protein
VLRLCADFFFRPDDFTEAIAICDPPLSVESRSHQSPLSRVADQARRAVQKNEGKAALASTRCGARQTQRGDGLDLEPPVEPSGFRSTAPLLPPDCSSIFLVLPEEPVVAFGAFGDGLFIDPPGFPSTARLVPLALSSIRWDGVCCAFATAMLAIRAAAATRLVLIFMAFSFVRETRPNSAADAELACRVRKA